MYEPLEDDLQHDYQYEDAWRQAITPTPSFSSSKTYKTANTSPDSFQTMLRPDVRHDLLNNASSGIYKSKTPRKCPSYYKASIDSQGRQKYCHGRFKKWQFILLHVVIIVILLLFVIIPLAYYVLVPSYIQYRLDTLETEKLHVDHIMVEDISNQTIGFKVKASLPPFFFWPIKAGFGPCEFTIYDNQRNTLGHLNIPFIEFWLNDDFDLDFAGNISLENSDVDAIDSIMKSFSSDGLKDFSIDSQSFVPLSALGIQWYSGLSLHKNIDVGDVKSDLKSLMTSIPPFFKNEIDSSINDTIPSSEWIHILPELGLPQFAINALNISMSDTGMTIYTTVLIDNPFKIGISNMKNLELRVGLEDATMAIIRLRELKLGLGLQTLDFELEIVLDDSEIDPTKFQDAVFRTSDKMLSGKYELVSAAIKGPFHVEGLDLEKMTKSLSIWLPVLDIVKQIESTNITDLMSFEGIKSTIAASKLEISVGSENIHVDSKMAIPIVIPIPRIVFPYTTYFELGRESVTAIKINTSPLVITREQDSLSINTDIYIHPINTNSAAGALARAINPLLSSTPSDSFVEIYHFGFLDDKMHKFHWCERLFENTPIKITLPGSLVCKSCIIKSIVKSENGLPVSIPQINIKQLESEPGFRAEGLAGITLPKWIPPVIFNIGFAQIDLWGTGKPLTKARLSQGLSFDIRNPHVVFIIDLILKADISAPIQELLEYLLLEEQLLSSLSVGASGLVMGKDTAHQIITFSKIFIDIKVEELKPMIRDIVGSVVSSLKKQTLLRLLGLDLQLKSSTLISSGVESIIFNPTNIGLDIGSVGLGVKSDGESLARLQIPPIFVKPGSQDLNLSVDAQLALGGEKSASVIGAIVEGITHQNQSIRRFSGLEFSGLVIQPKNSPNGPGTIDMLSQVIISIPASLIGSALEFLVSNVGSDDAIIDISALIPSERDLLSLRPVPKAIQLRASPGSTLNAGFSAEYANPLPLSISIPYVEMALSLGDLDHEIVTIRISGLKINRGRGLISLGANIEFNTLDTGLPTNIALLFSNFLAGRIQPAIGVKKIAFGINTNDKNQILHDIGLDLTAVTEHLGWVGPRISDYVEQLLMEYIDANSINIHGSLDRRGVAIGLGDNLSVSFQEIGIDFKPSKKLQFHILAKLLIPFDVDISLPYISGFMSIDDISFVNAEIEGIIFDSRSQDSFSLNMILKTYDEDPLADHLGTISEMIRKNEAISNILHFSEVAFGSSPNDIITAFSDINVPIPLSSLWKLSSRLIGQLTNTVTISHLIHSLGVQIYSFNALTFPNKMINCGADVAFNVINMSVSGLGFFLSDVSLTGTPFFSIASPGISINSGLNSMHISTNVQFPSSNEIQNKVAHLVSDVVSGSLKLVNESSFDISGVIFGSSESESLRFLRKIRLDIPASLFLNPTILDFVLSTAQQVLQTDFQHMLENILRRMNVYSVNLDASESSYISVNGEVGIKELPFKVDLEMGHFDGSATLNEESLASIALVNKLVVQSVNSTVNAAFHAHIALDDTAMIQEHIANLVDKIMSNGNLADNIGGKGLKFGVNENDLIDTFSKSSFYIPVEPILQLVKDFLYPLFEQIMHGNSSVGLDIQKLDVDINDHNSFGADAVVQLVGIPNTINVNMPFISTDVLLDNMAFCSAKLDVRMVNGKVFTKVSIPFASNKSNGQKIVSLVRNILWHESDAPNYEVSVHNVLFGSSESSASRIASKVGLKPPFGLIMGLVKNFFDEKRPIELYNIAATVADVGVTGFVTSSVLPSFLPLNVTLPMFNAAILYQIAGEGPLIKAADAAFDNLSVSPGKPVSFGVLIEPNFENNSIVDMMKEAVLFMLNDTDYAQNARLGYIKLTGLNGAVFDLMDEAYMQAPDLYLYRPLTFDVRAVNPLTKQGVEIVPLEFVVTFPNTGPLHINLGQMKVSIDAGDQDIIVLESKGSIVVKNVLEGGAIDTNPENGVFGIKFPWSNFNPVHFIRNLIELMRKRDFSMDIDLIRPGFGPVEWLNRLTKELVSMQEVKALIPVLISMIGRIHFKLFGIPITHRGSAVLD